LGTVFIAHGYLKVFVVTLPGAAQFFESAAQVNQVGQNLIVFPSTKGLGAILTVVNMTEPIISF
jgi:uncharacterized membrane protein YphA (DoxX/SURF4 family)